MSNSSSQIIFRQKKIDREKSEGGQKKKKKKKVKNQNESLYEHEDGLKNVDFVPRWYDAVRVFTHSNLFTDKFHFTGGGRYQMRIR